MTRQKNFVVLPDADLAPAEKLRNAVVSCRLDVMDALLASGTDINSTVRKSTSLMLAAGYFVPEDGIKLTNFLLSRGADPNIIDGNGVTALYIAAREKENLDMCKLLIEHDADVNFTVKRYNNASLLQLHSGWFGTLPVLELFLASGANVDYQDAGGKTALMEAAERGGIAKIEAILRHNPNAGLKDNNGKTARDYALKQNPRSDAGLIDSYLAKKTVLGIIYPVAAQVAGESPAANRLS
jgi:ankyrin repeat protein